jgi:quinol monooxygenase YgiN
MYLRISQHRIRPACEQDFIAAMIEYARAMLSRGHRCQRVDIVRDIDAAHCYVLCEVFPDQPSRDRAYRSLARLRHQLSGGHWSRWHVSRPRRLHGFNVSPNDAGMKTPIAPLAELPAKPRRDKRYLHFGIWHIRPKYADAYARAMSANARASAGTEPTCHRFDVIRDLAIDHRFYLYQIYQDQRAHDVVHVAQPHLAKLFANPAWNIWSDQMHGPVMGLVSETGYSRTIRGVVVWSHDPFVKPR